MPIIIELKRLLEKHRSPFLKNLMEYLKELLKDFKDEVNDILVADKQLAKEIQYDLRQLAAQTKTNAPGATTANTAVMSPQKKQQLMSPRTSSPRPELANFSVPRVRTSATNSVPSTPRSSQATAPEDSQAAKR